MKKDDRPIHILLIEDNPGDTLLVEEYLEELFGKAELTQVSAFREACELLNSGERFDTILLDLSLPDYEGMNLVDEILRLSGAVPVIILTGYSNLEFSMESLSKGVSDYLLKDELSSTLLYKSIVYSIERNAFSGRLKESEKNYRDLFELSPQPMFLFDPETLEFLDVNRAAIDHYGYTKDEILSMTLRDIRPKEDIPYLESVKQELAVSEEPFEYNKIRHKKKDGTIIQVEIHTNNVQFHGKNARIVIVNDVTEKLKEEERLKVLESVITNSTETVILLEAEPTDLPNRKIQYVNSAFTDATGYSSEEVLGRPLNFLYGEKTDTKKISKVLLAMKNREVCKVELINYKKDGTPFWVETSLVPVADKNGNHTHWVVIGRDITKQKNYQDQLKGSLEEKEVLLSEIHHRVKNNLAVVSGLMQLQAFEEDNKEVERRLMNSIMRIRTMASIHELLYESNSFSHVDFTSMLRKLSDDISKSMTGNKDISINLIPNPVQLNINQAIPCALMINEVLTNAFKHAFIEKNNGSIKIRIDSDGDNVSVTIQDDGIGLPDIDSSSSLGMQLISILSQQLNANYSYDENKLGTLFSIDFIKNDVKGAASSLSI